MFKKEYSLVYILIVLMVGLFIASKLFPTLRVTDFMTKQFSLSMPTLTSGKVKTSVVIDFGDAKYSYNTIEAGNALEALTEASKQENMQVTTKHYDFGDLVTKVGAKENTADKSWLYYINGKWGDVAANKKALSSGDTVEWRYETPKQ